MPGQPKRIALDSSYLIPLLCEWHIHHSRTRRSYQQLSGHAAHIILPAHAVLECYSVLTRIPPPHRLPSSAARQLLEENFFNNATVAGVRPAEAWMVLQSLAALGLGGGRVYDAAIAHCAAAAGATVLFTWNTKHFASIAPPGLEIREP